MCCIVVDLGLMPYGKCLELQEKIVLARQKGILQEDVLLLVEHPSVLTFGRNFDESELKVSKEQIKQMGIEMFQINRGGNVTYHGQGQLVGYPIIKMSLSESLSYPAKLEQLMLMTGSGYCDGLCIRNDIYPETNKRYVGLWWKSPDRALVCKVGSVGVQFKQFQGSLFSMHGFAINVCTKNINHFDLIEPCGLKGVKVTSLEKISGKDVSLQEFKEKLISNFTVLFNYKEVKHVSLEDISKIYSV